LDLAWSPEVHREQQDGHQSYTEDAKMSTV
jgi:hypothetical protein